MSSRHYIYIIGILLLAALATSCEKERGQDKPLYSGDRAIAIQPYVVDEDWQPTRAMSPSLTTPALQSDGFGVYAYYTGSDDFSSIGSISGLVFNNRHFSYNSSSSAWENTGKAEFWPTAAGEKLTFFAYAPWSEWHDKVDVTGDVPSIKYDDYVAQDLSVAELEKQRDILWGTNTSGMPHMNVGASSYANEGTVDMHFRHAVAKVDFAVRGSLAGEGKTLISSGSISTTSTGSWSDPTPELPNQSSGEVPISDDDLQSTTTYRQTGNWFSGYTYYYTCTQTQTQTKTFTQYQYRTRVQSRSANYSTEGKRYLIENVSFKGFNKTGTLLLDNSSAYTPTWTNVTAFNGADPEYVLNGGNVLSQSLQYVSAPTVQSNYNTYTGVTETSVDLMRDGYYLYAIPKTISSTSDRIQVKIKYHILNVGGNLAGTDTREIIEVRKRTLTCTRSRQRTSAEYQSTSSTAPSVSSFSFPNWGSFGEWSSWSGSWGTETVDSEGDWVSSNQTLSNASVNYDDDTSPELTGEILTPFQGGRAYTITLILAGDKIELDVVPRPWVLEETSFDYTSEINDVIQALTYDSAYIDYADAAGNVYINNRMGKFYFRLGRGKYIAWQASLVGDAAFGFTDENGNFLLDGGGNRVTSIRGGVDPDVTNYIYIRAVNSSATVTSRAKLRIYYIDSDNNVTAALNLVNLQGVNEWTIVQNAN